MSSPHPQFGRWRRLLIGSVLAALLAAPAVQAQQLSKAAASLDLVPADAQFYSVSLRNREQLDAVLNSKAWAKLSALPLAKLAWAKVEEAWNQPGGPQAELKAWYEQEENRELVRFVGDMFSDEVFAYGGGKTADFLTVLAGLQQANQFAPLAAMLEGKNPQDAQKPEVRVRALLESLNDDVDLLAAPDLVMGFKLRDPAPARKQLARLDKLVQAWAAGEPKMKGRWAKAKLAGGDFHTLRLDGDLIPWDDIPWDQVEEQPGQFDKLKKKLRAMKLTVSVGLRDNFVIVALGETTAPLKGLGEAGKRLAERKEFEPLARFADRRLTSIAYASPEWHAAQHQEQDFGAMFEGLLEKLKTADLTPQQQEKIRKDLKALREDFKSSAPAPGPALGFSFLTDRGSESYQYAWTTGPAPKVGQPLTILKHVGGAPVCVSATRGESDPEGYKRLVKWLKIGWGYAEEYALPKAPDDMKEKYEAVMKQARPLLARFNQVTETMLIPALAEGQGAFVLDAKLKSKQWHQALPATENPQALPLLEVAFVFGVSDAALLKKAAGEYREIINGFLALAGRGDSALPPPETKATKAGTLYSYPLPEAAGLDPQLTLTAGLSDRWLALTLSPSHATRLLRPTDLKVGGPLITNAKQPLEVNYFSWEGFVTAVGPWVEYGLDVAGVDANDGMDLRGQVRTVLDVLKVFRHTASVSYADGQAVVTHMESVIMDIE